MLKGADLAARRRFDFKVLTDMRGPVFDFSAYRSTEDLDRRRNAITSESAADGASKYVFRLKVRTHVSATAFSNETEIGIDTDVADYPRKPPNTWVISPQIPWSPHFKRGAPVCLGGELWQLTEGHITLGHLVIHIARLLNWDEKGRGQGYVGWNAQAIAHHQKAYKGQPIDPGLVYPPLPRWLSGDAGGGLSFEISARTQPPDLGFRRLR